MLAHRGWIGLPIARAHLRGFSAPRASSAARATDQSPHASSSPGAVAASPRFAWQTSRTSSTPPSSSSSVATRSGGRDRDRGRRSRSVDRSIGRSVDRPLTAATKARECAPRRPRRATSGFICLDFYVRCTHVLYQRWYPVVYYSSHEQLSRGAVRRSGHRDGFRLRSARAPDGCARTNVARGQCSTRARTAGRGATS